MLLGIQLGLSLVERLQLGIGIGVEGVQATELGLILQASPGDRRAVINELRQTPYYRMPYHWPRLDRLESQLDSEENFVAMPRVDSGV
jgi:hypothetical protein